MTLRAAEYWGETDQRWDLDGLTVTATRYAPLQEQTRHRHENPTYFFLLGGEFCDVSAELGSKYPQRFELLFHPAGCWHEGIAGTEGRYGLNIEPNDLWFERAGISQEDLGAYRLENDPIRSSEMLRLATCGFDSDSAADQILEILLPNKATEKESSDWMNRLDRLLTEPETHWTLKTLAEELGVHPVYLARVFRERHRCSVTQWLLRRRLLESARALLEGRPASEVAHEAGFADQSHFGRAFRAYLNLTPRQFQQRWTK